MEICFNLIFHNSNSFDTVVQLSYKPCPVWSINRDILINLNPRSPHYQQGGFARLIAHFNEHQPGLIPPEGDITLVSQYNENAVFEMNELVRDIRDTGYSVRIVLN